MHTQCATILAWANENGYHLNMKPNVLGARLSEINAPDLQVLREDDAAVQSDSTLKQLLSHRSSARFVGFFVPREKQA